MASELIIQLQDQFGNFSCEKYANIPTPRSVYLAICFNNSSVSQQLAIHLKQSLINYISNLNSSFISQPAPCGGNAKSFGNCQAINIVDNYKLLIVVSDGSNILFNEPAVCNWNQEVLPIIKQTAPYNLPHPFNIPQACFWHNDISESIPTICRYIGISPFTQRVFISYRRIDTSKFADQLFDKLNRKGFEVFLDRFSIDPGINFQKRLYQELADKAMVVLIESPDYLKSKWVQYEIDFAKKYRLGLFAVNVNNSPKVKTIMADRRKDVLLKPNSELNETDLDDLCLKIEEQHTQALYIQKHYLTNSIYNTLKACGAYPTIDNRGFISFSNISGNKTFKVWAIPRPPETNDYYHTDSNRDTATGIIVGPMFIEETRQAINEWLEKKSLVNFYTEGQILNLNKLVK